MNARLLKLLLKLSAPRDERGSTAVEYGLMVALIAVVLIFAVGTLGSGLSDIFQSVANSL